MIHKYPHFKPTEELKKELKTVRTGSHTTWNINYHIVWIPKYRKPLLKHAKLKEILESILRGQSESRGWKVLALEIMPDHIHIFLSVPASYSVSQVVNQLKGNTSIQLRRVFPYLKSLIKKSLWADGYYVSTAGFVSQEQVRRYILEQDKRLKIHREPRLDTATEKALDKTITDYISASIPPKPKGVGYP